MTPTKIYTFTIPAGGSFPLLTIGDFFKVQNAVGAIEVRGDTFGTIGAVLAGQGLARTRFNRLEFVDKSGAANVVSVLIAGEAFVDDRITGEVSVIDGARARTTALIAFAGTMPVVNTMGMYSQAQLRNPPGSGRNVIVNKVACSGNLAANVYIAGDTAALVNPGVNVVANKRLGAAVGVATLRYGNIATIQPATALASLFTLSVAPGVVSQWVPSEPIVLIPGMSLDASIDQPNVNMNASFEWFEEAIL